MNEIANEEITSSALETEEIQLEATSEDESRMTVVDNLATSLSVLVDQYSRTNAKVGNDVLNIVRTIAEINRESELSVGIRVEGDLYRFAEYRTLSQLAELVDGAAIKIADDEEAIDFKDRKQWAMNRGKVLTPSGFALATKQLTSALRIRDPQITTLTREFETLAVAAEYSLVGGKVASSSQKRVTFLKSQVYKGNYYGVNLKEFARRKVCDLLD